MLLDHCACYSYLIQPRYVSLTSALFSYWVSLEGKEAPITLIEQGIDHYLQAEKSNKPFTHQVASYLQENANKPNDVGVIKHTLTCRQAKATGELAACKAPLLEFTQLAEQHALDHKNLFLENQVDLLQRCQDQITWYQWAWHWENGNLSSLTIIVDQLCCIRCHQQCCY